MRTAIFQSTWTRNSARPFFRRVQWGLLTGVTSIFDGIVSIVTVGQINSSLTFYTVVRLTQSESRRISARRKADQDPDFASDGSWRHLAALGYPGAHITCSAAPFQVEGFNDGRYWYFRSRHGAWSLGISTESLDDAIGVRWSETTEETAKRVLTGTDPADLDLSHGNAPLPAAALFVANALESLDVRPYSTDSVPPSPEETA